jgi:hypothetical protein
MPGVRLKVEENRPDEAPPRTGGVPKGRHFDNPRRQPGEHGLKIMSPQRGVTSCSCIGTCVVSGRAAITIVFRTQEQRMFFPTMPLRVTPRWGYPGWDWPPHPRLTPGVIKIASLRDAPGFSNASTLEKMSEVSWSISIRSENFGLPPDKRVQISLWHPPLLTTPFASSFLYHCRNLPSSQSC